MKKLSWFAICMILILGMSGCGHKSNSELIDIEQFRCQDSIQTVFDVLGGENTEAERYVYEKINLWGYNGTATFCVRDDEETIQEFYCTLELNEKEFEKLISYFSEKYGAYVVDDFGETIKLYEWYISEENGEIGYEEDEIGYDRIVIQDNGEEEYKIFFKDEWSAIKDEAYYEAVEESSKIENEWNSLLSEKYEYDNESMSISLSVDDKNEYHLSIYLDIEEKWKAAYAYTILSATIKGLEEKIDSFDKFNTMILVSCGNDFISSNGIAYTTEEPIETIDIATWITEGLLDTKFNSEEAERFSDQLTNDFISFLKK